MEIKYRKYKDIIVIDLYGELDLYNSSDLLRAFHALRSKGLQKFIINMKELTYIDSSGVGSLIQIQGSARESSMPLVLTGIHGTVEKVLSLSRMDSFFSISENPEEAVKTILKGIE